MIIAWITSDGKTRKAIIVESHALTLLVESQRSLRPTNLRSGVRKRRQSGSLVFGFIVQLAIIGEIAPGCEDVGLDPPSRFHAVDAEFGPTGRLRFFTS